MSISFSWHVNGAVAEAVECDSNQKPDCMEMSNKKESFFLLYGMEDVYVDL